MYKETSKVPIVFRIFSFLVVLLFLFCKNDWGSLISLFLIYLWISHVFKVKGNRKWTLFTFFVILFHSFCGKLLLFSKFCIMVCFLESYFFHCSFFEFSRFLSFFPSFWQRKILSIYATWLQIKFVQKEIKNCGINDISVYLKPKKIKQGIQERYIVLRKSPVFFSFDMVLFLLLHILLFLIYFY